MEMDFDLAHSLVWDAVRVVLPDATFSPDRHARLDAIGLETPENREHFKAYLMRFILEAGYQINHAKIPTGAEITPMQIISVLQDESKKSSGTTSKSMGDLPGESTKGNKP